MISAVAGTFNVLHDGHKALIDRAFETADTVYIGITSDEMAKASRSFINTFYIRKKAVESYVSSKMRPYRIFSIDDAYGPDEMMDSVNILVVSEETLDNGRKVIERASSRGHAMELSVVPLVKRENGSKISSTDIMHGICSRNGSTDAIDIAVGSMNPVKVEAVRAVMERIFGEVRIFACDAPSGVPEQPFDGQTVQGAKNRAEGALKDHTLSVGIEAGVFNKHGTLYDFQYCAILDQEGRFTIGTGSGFRYPDSVVELVRSGKTVGEAMKIVYSDSNAGRSQGAIGILSRGLLDRKALTEQSVTAAMVPRLWEER